MRTQPETRRGGNAIEFALIAPVLLTLLFGIAEYSWFFFNNQTAVTAAADGARAGSMSLAVMDTAGNVTNDIEYNATMAARRSLTASGVDSGDAEVACVKSDDATQISCTVSLSGTTLTNYLPVPATPSGRITRRIEGSATPSGVGDTGAF
jgi:Flp pilus assembly protein TadG